MGPLPQRKHCLIMLQVLFLASLASAVPAPEADPLFYTGHPLTYSVPYVTYHAPVCKTEIEEVKGQSWLEPSPLLCPTTTASTRSPRCATQSRRLSLPPSLSSLACRRVRLS